jgi:GT2 family glycosyltransferase
MTNAFSRPLERLKEARAPLISVVTPSYNQGKFIGHTIRSVLEQDYPHIEYWVIDGGSTDETLDVLRSFEGDPRFRWISEPDRGQSDAINKGITRCTGEIFCWLCSDDMFTPGALRRVADEWVASGPAIIYGPSRYIDADGRDLGHASGPVPGLTLPKLLRFASYGLTQPSTFVPTAAVQAAGGVNESLHYAMDLDLWLRIAEGLPFRYMPHYLALYRHHDASKGITQAIAFLDEFALITAKAVGRGLVSSAAAQSELDLYAATVYTSTQRLFGPAVRRLLAAVLRTPATLPQALFILAKALFRHVVGEHTWIRLRRWRSASAGSS